MENLKYYKNLDGIRGIAVLLVMFGHFFVRIHSKYIYLEAILQKISILGQLGVALFFVLSGFLITRILLYTREKPGYFKNFYVRRVLRIFPLYYFFLLLYFFLFPHLLNIPSYKFSQQIYYYSYLQNFALTFNWNAGGPIHFWSLAVEEHFYLFWPLLIFIFRKKEILKIIIIIVISSILLRYYFLLNSLDVYYFTFTRIDALAIGSLLSLFEQKIVKVNIKKQLYLLFVISLFIPTFILWTFWGGEANYFMQILKYFLFSFGFFAVIGYLIKLDNHHFITKFLISTPLSYTGKISYGLYVYHLFAFEIINYYLHPKFWVVNFIISFALAYILSILSYYSFEKRFLKLKKYFSNK